MTICLENHTSIVLAIERDYSKGIGTPFDELTDFCGVSCECILIAPLVYRAYVHEGETHKRKK
jgi:hypothetical protein